MVYSILVRWGPEWDGQSVIYTESKELFELLKDNTGNNQYFTEFSDKLQEELEKKYSEFDYASPYSPEPIEDIDICQAIEYLECYTPQYPLTVLAHTEFTPSWNW